MVICSEKSQWDMKDADLSAWSSLLAYAVDMALKDHATVSDALELVVSNINNQNVVS